MLSLRLIMLHTAVCKLFIVAVVVGLVVVGLRQLPHRLICPQKRDTTDVLVSDHVVHAHASLVLESFVLSIISIYLLHRIH